MIWQDYFSGPFWLKVPLELAALIVVIALMVLRGGSQPLTQKVEQLESVKMGPANELKSAVADRPRRYTEARADVSRSREVLDGPTAAERPSAE